MPSRNPALLVSLFSCALLTATLPGCKWMTKKKLIGPDGSAPDSGSPSASASIATHPSAAPTPTGPVDPLAPRDRTLVNRTKDDTAAVEALVTKGVLSDPAKPGDSDAVQRCSTIEDARDRIETLPDADGDLAKLIAETKRLCSLEVPILSCNNALRQAGNPGSQASHKLVCGFAQKDFAKARAAKPNDRRIFDLGSRLTATCN